MTIKRSLQLALILLLLDRHPEDVCGTLQKSDVVFAKLASGFAVDFQYAEWRAVALENDVHGAVNAVLDQQVRCPKALLMFEVVGNNRLAGAQRVAGGGLQIGSDAGRADDILAPADSGSNQKAVLSWYVFQDFAVLRIQPFGCHTCGLIEHADQAGTLKRKDAQFGKELLLTNTLMKSAGGWFVGRTIVWRRLDDGFFLVG